MNWIRKHGESLGIIGGVIAAVATATWIISATIHGVGLDFNTKLAALDKDFSIKLNDIDKRLIKIETILTIKGITRDCLAGDPELPSAPSSTS